MLKRADASLSLWAHTEHVAVIVSPSTDQSGRSDIENPATGIPFKITPHHGMLLDLPLFDTAH